MPFFLTTSLRAIPAAPALICAGLLLASCGGGSGSSPTPTAPVADLSPVPSDVPIDIAQADQLYYEGDYEGALTIYSAAAQAGTPEEQQAGLWAIARIQAERGDNGAAERTVEALRAANPPADRDRQALLLLGAAEFAQGDFEEAREALEEYVARGGAAWPYANIQLAQIAAAEGETEEALEAINEALLAGLPPAANYEALLALAGVQAKDGKTALALDAYRRAVEEAASDEDAAEALWLLAEEAAKGGDSQAAADALEDLVVTYPGSVRALEALDSDLVISNPAVSTRERGIVLFRHRVNGEAGTAFQAIVDSGAAGAAEAHYYLGILAERSELWDEAIAQYNEVINGLAPGENDALRAQAYWDAGTVLERLGLTADAAIAYAAVGEVMPAHSLAGEGMFRAGLLSYLNGVGSDALFYWTRFLEIAPNAEEKARANYWLSRASEAAGDPGSAAVYLQDAAAADPLDYYGLRAAALLSGVTEFPDASSVAAPAPDWARVEAWLTAWLGPEDAAARDALFAGEPWLRAVELLSTGLTARADDEFRDLLADNAKEPWLVYRLIREISAYGRPWVTSPAAASLLRADAPPEILQLVYPLEFLRLVQSEAEANGFSPLLLLALVRQESLYDPSAVSIADAMGLTQVIPSTADGLAAELEVEAFSYNDLLRPNVSLRFGAYYLGSLLEGFGGTAPPALAGYNGGPGNAGRWWENAAGDPDLFLEVIDFPETRIYVELVLENYARYLYAYGYMETPSLPLP